MRLEADRLRFAYRRGADVLRGVSIHLEGGETVFILGPNGCGKTTLLECLAGVRCPSGGTVRLDGADLLSLSLPERARRIALVPQIHEAAFPYAVLDAVLLGRAPHLHPLAHPRAEDRREASRALATVGIETLSRRSFASLSGGERRLALIARGLAQGAETLLLDEPDAHLDPAFQERVLGVVRRSSEEGRSVALSTHDPTSAANHADRVLFLIRGVAARVGPPDAVITPEALEEAYGVPFAVLSGPHGLRAVAPRAARPIP